MNSIEKAYMALEQLADADDDDFTAALPLPIPVTMLRGLLPVIARSIPEDPAVLDEFLTGVGEFCHQMRSDEPAAIES